PEEGVRSGFEYKQAPHIKLEHTAKNEPPKEEKLYDKPEVETSKVRVTGPFTSEAVPSLRIRPIDGNEPKIQGSNRELSQTGETGNQAMWRDELRSTGIRAIGGKIISFSRIEPMLATRYLHAKGEM
ncbi:MAG TPA: site-specific DNA-methyltransferase, partial [Algoriphagus sp.]|nr:site-specific DNA-methyltransferase [Algoriphagus sp.]